LTGDKLRSLPKNIEKKKKEVSDENPNVFGTLFPRHVIKQSWYALSKRYKCICLMFDRSQKHDKEILSAVKIAKSFKTEYSIVKINLSWSGDLFTNKNKEVLVCKHLSKTVLLYLRFGKKHCFSLFCAKCDLC
jgi:hypothetical protein